jgi:hypothetical protein
VALSGGLCRATWAAEVTFASNRFRLRSRVHLGGPTSQHSPNQHTCESEPQLSWIHHQTTTPQHVATWTAAWSSLAAVPFDAPRCERTHLFDGGQTSPCRRALLVAAQ